MAGLAFNALGRRPEEGDTVTMESVVISVDEIDGLRIKRLRVNVGRGSDMDAGAGPNGSE